MNLDWAWWRKGNPGYVPYQFVLAAIWGALAYAGHVRHEHVLLVWGAIACFYRLGVALEAGAE